MQAENYSQTLLGSSLSTLEGIQKAKQQLQNDGIQLKTEITRLRKEEWDRQKTQLRQLSQSYNKLQDLRVQLENKPALSLNDKLRLRSISEQQDKIRSELHRLSASQDNTMDSRRIAESSVTLFKAEMLKFFELREKQLSIEKKLQTQPDSASQKKLQGSLTQIKKELKTCPFVGPDFSISPKRLLQKMEKIGALLKQDPHSLKKSEMKKAMESVKTDYQWGSDFINTALSKTENWQPMTGLYELAQKDQDHFINQWMSQRTEIQKGQFSNLYTLFKEIEEAKWETTHPKTKVKA